MNHLRKNAQVLSLIVVVGLLALSAIGSAELMFWTSLASLLLLFIWFAADRKIWLATVSGLTFVFTALLTASRLY